MTTDRTQGTTWPTNAEREALRRCRSFVAGNAFGVPVEAREQHLEYLLDALAPHVARREREAGVRALRDAADSWTQGAWGSTPRRADRVADRMAASQFAGDWLRERADRIERGEP